MSKKLFGKVFILLLVVGLLFAVAPTGQAQAAASVTTAAELSAAIAGSETEITVMANISVGSVVGHAFSIPTGRTVTLDLNGHTISAETSNGGVFSNAGTLTISDNSIAKGGMIINTNTTQTTTGEAAKSAISNTGVLTVNAGVIVAGPAEGQGSWPGENFNPAYGIDNLNGGDVIINDATVSGAYGLRNFAWAPGTTITINGGTITGKTGIAMQNGDPNDGTLTINGNTTVTATTGSAIYAAGVTANNHIVINGGTFSGTGDYGAVVVVAGTLDINGGTFIGRDDSYSLLNYRGVVNVTAGTFYAYVYGGTTGTTGITTFAPSEGNSILVAGGIDGTVVGADLVEIWMVHNTTQDIWYPTIQAAINAAANGDTINIAAGTYEEHVTNGTIDPKVLGKRVNLIGETDEAGNPLTILQGSMVINLDSSMADNIRIENIKFLMTDKSHLELYGVNGVTVKNCVFDGDDASVGKYGVQFTRRSSNGNSDAVFEDCEFKNQPFGGIQGYVTNLTVTGSTMTVRYGINLQASSGTLTVTGSQITAVATSDGFFFAIQSNTNVNITNSSIIVDPNGYTPKGIVAINLRDAGTSLHADHNIIIGEVRNETASAEFVATPNWWGQATGPAAGQLVGNVSYVPWCGDEDCSFLVYLAGSDLQASINATPAGGTLYVPDMGTDPDYTGTYTVGGKTLILGEGVTIQASSPCFTVTGDNTIITAETIGMAKCVLSDTYGIEVNAGIKNVVIEGIYFDTDFAGEVYGSIHFAGAIEDVLINDNYFRAYAALVYNGIIFAQQPTGVVEIKGNLFEMPNMVGCAVSNFYGTSTIDAQFNSFGSMAGHPASVYSPSQPERICEHVDYSNYTHADVYVESSATPWLNQEVVGQEFTLTVKANLTEVTGAKFTLEYDPALVELVDDSLENLSGFSAAGLNMFEVDETLGLITFNASKIPAISGAEYALFSADFTASSVGAALFEVDALSDEFAMFPGYASSSNVYGYTLLPVTVDLIELPTVASTFGDSYYLVGEARDFTMTVTNFDTAYAAPELQITIPAGLTLAYNGTPYTGSLVVDLEDLAVDEVVIIDLTATFTTPFNTTAAVLDVDLVDALSTEELLVEESFSAFAYTTPTISSDDVDGYYVTGIEQGFTVSLDNPSTGGNFAGVVVDLKITGADLADIASLYYWETELDPDAFALWTLTPDGSGNLIGTFGPPTVGFPMTAPYSIDVPFKVTFANPGSYPFELTLRDVATGTILDTFTDTAVVYESPTISSEDIQGYYLTEEAREFTVSVNNPLSPDGMAYNPTMFKFTIPGVTLADVINTARYYETYDPADTWQTLPLRQVGSDVVGWYGLVNYGGFNLPADGLEHPGLLEVNFKTPGEYDVIVELYLMDGTVETWPDYVYEDDTVRLLASKEFTMFAYDQPELTGSGLPYYLVGDAQASTTTIINPSTGYPYGDSIVFDITIFDHEVADITNVTCTYFGVPLDVTPLLQDAGDDITARLVGANGFFTVTNPYNESITCTTTFATAGTYETLAEMVHVVGGVERVVATREATTVVYPKPVITSPELAGPFQKGLEATVTINVDNVGAMNIPNDFILHLDLPAGTVVVYGAQTVTCDASGCDIAVTLDAGANAIDLDITFNDPYVGTLGVTLVDPAVEPDRELATYTTPTDVLVYGNVASVTGTVSMQGRTTRAGVLVTLAGSFDTYTATSINTLSDNVSFTNLASGVYAITVEQARYLDITITHDATIDLATLQAMANLMLRAGDANDDNYINPGDASIVGAQYGTGTIADQGDINFDNRVNIQDLALIGGNLDLQSADPSAANYAYGNWMK